MLLAKRFCYFKAGSMSGVQQLSFLVAQTLIDLHYKSIACSLLGCCQRNLEQCKCRLCQKKKRASNIATHQTKFLTQSQQEFENPVYPPSAWRWAELPTGWWGAASFLLLSQSFPIQLLPSDHTVPGCALLRVFIITTCWDVLRAPATAIKNSTDMYEKLFFFEKRCFQVRSQHNHRTNQHWDAACRRDGAQRWVGDNRVTTLPRQCVQEDSGGREEYGGSCY